MVEGANNLDDVLVVTLEGLMTCFARPFSVSVSHSSRLIITTILSVVYPIGRGAYSHKYIPTQVKMEDTKGKLRSNGLTTITVNL